MKTKFISHLMKCVAAALLLGASAALIFAGPPPNFWNRSKPIATVKEAVAVKADETVMMVCGACKTAMVRTMKHVGPPNGGHEDSLVIGSKHKCDHCGGEITVVQGKTKDTMQHNCSMCGEGAAFCCVAPTMPEKK